MLEEVSTMPSKNRSVYRRKVSEQLKQYFKLLHAYFVERLLLKESAKFVFAKNSIYRMMIDQSVDLINWLVDWSLPYTYFILQIEAVGRLNINFGWKKQWYKVYCLKNNLLVTLTLSASVFSINCSVELD